MKKLLWVAGALAGGLLISSYGQGPLGPTGAPAPVYKTLDEVEPRIPIPSEARSGGPYEINNSGSYYLTGPLKQLSSGVPVIQINADRVTLDLNGFSVEGPDGGNAGNHGIVVESGRAEIFNGTIRRTAGMAIRAGEAWDSVQLVIRDVRFEKVGHGVVTMPFSPTPAELAETSATVVRDCQFTWIDGWAVHTASGSTVENCIGMRINYGVRAGNHAHITRNVFTTWDHTGHGIHVGEQGRVQGNMVEMFGWGIEAGPGSEIADNLVTGSEIVSITVGDGSVVRNNAVFHEDLGVDGGDDVRIAGNAFFRIQDPVKLGTRATVENNVFVPKKVGSNGVAISAWKYATVSDNQIVLSDNGNGYARGVVATNGLVAKRNIIRALDSGITAAGDATVQGNFVRLDRNVEFASYTGSVLRLGIGFEATEGYTHLIQDNVLVTAHEADAPAIEVSSSGRIGNNLIVGDQLPIQVGYSWIEIYGNRIISEASAAPVLHAGWGARVYFTENVVRSQGDILDVGPSFSSAYARDNILDSAAGSLFTGGVSDTYEHRNKRPSF